MKANENKILRLLSGSDKRFIIPVYQRPYSWKKENCVQLMKDLRDVCEYGYESHFFGSIVFVSQHNGLCDEHIIIDGQQRLTTVSLLLLAIRNYINENKDIESKINPNKILSYLTDEFADDEKKLKLKLVQGDDDAYNKLIQSKIPVVDNCITANYDYFYSQIEKMSPEEIEGLFNAITKLDIVSISLQPEAGDDPQLIFESMNSTGLDLEPSDKIRNYVLMRMSAKEQDKFYKKYWEPLEELVDRKDITKFFRYYLDVKLRRNVAEKKLYAEFKLYRENSNLPMEEIMEDILKYAEYFKIIVCPRDKKTVYSDVLERINKLEVNTCIPLIMDIFNAEDDGRISSEDALLTVEIIENYIVRREICGLETNQLNKVFVSLGAEIQRAIEDDNVEYFEAFKREILKKSGKARFPNNHDFADRFITYELYNAKSSMRKYFLERLENCNSKEKVAVEEQIAEGTLTIEHIMPQTLTPEWKKALGEGWELVHTKYLDTPGNLTLTAYNSDYSNSSFDKKKNLTQKGFAYSKLSLNSYIKECDIWGEAQIIERANLLYKLAEKIWWMPQTEYAAGDSAEWVYWDEEYNYTNKVIDYVSVMGMIIKVANVTDAYRKVHEALYDLDPTVYHSEEFAWFKKKGKSFKKPYKIGKDGYIETNRNSQQKMDSIRHIAEVMELSSEDIQYSVVSESDMFSLEDEKTYYNVTVGKMAFAMFKYVLENELITEEEVALLKTKEYTKKLFNKTDYPILADSRDANRGNSKVLRYRAEAVKFGDKQIYVTFQWFDGNREDIINWFKGHKSK